MIVLLIAFIITSSVIFNFRPWFDFKNGGVWYSVDRRTKERLYKKLWGKN